MYAEGTGVPKGAGQAVALFKKACDGGEPKACSKLAEMYSFSFGVKGDKTQALNYYRKACAFKDRDACFFYEELKNRQNGREDKAAY